MLSLRVGTEKHDTSCLNLTSVNILSDMTCSTWQYIGIPILPIWHDNVYVGFHGNYCASCPDVTYECRRDMMDILISNIIILTNHNIYKYS